MNMENCRKILGMDISAKEMLKLLRQSRFDAKLKGKEIEVSYVPYRNDIMDERDVMEDIAISFGYNNIEPEEPKIYTKGEGTKKERLSNKIREICIGLGIQEVLNFTLSSKEDLLERMRIKDDIVEIENPVSSSWCVFRNSLIPNCLRFLSYNKHVEYPQKIFEIGDVIKIDEGKETKTRDVRNLAILITGIKIGYEEISSLLNSLMENLKVEYKIEEMRNEKFIEGRCASVFVDKKLIGEIGEIHPEILENFGLEMPVVSLELNLEGL